LQAATAWDLVAVALFVGMLGVSTLDGIIGRRPSILFSYGVSIVGIICSGCCSGIRTTGC